MSPYCANTSTARPAGGVSMGDRDLIKPLLERNGTIHFGRVRMKPGKPLTFATLELEGGRQMLVFGLPGGYERGPQCVDAVSIWGVRCGARNPWCMAAHVAVLLGLQVCWT